ncbi:MAG: hypothetical protein GXZ18_02055 [Synergistaceae bacterium]|nr:hypothetical protein [Synergistaceae bacterium]
MENDQKDHYPLDQDKRLYMNYNGEYDDNEIDIVDILMIFWSKKFLIAAFVVVFALVALGYTTLMKPSYESRTTLLFMPPVPAEMSAEMRKDSPQLNSSPLFPPDVYLSLATADDLLHDTIKAVYNEKSLSTYQVPTPENLRENMKVELNKSSEKADSATKLTLTVRIKASEPEIAVELLNVWGKLFIQRNSDMFTDRTGASYNYTKDSMVSIKNDLDKAEDSLVLYQKKNPVKVLESKLNSMNTIYANLLSKYDNEMLLLAPLESSIKTTKKFISLEPEKLSLSKGMSTEAVWNHLAKELTPEEIKQLKNMNIDDEILNNQNNVLKSRLYNDEIKLSSLRASTTETRKRIGSIRKECEATEAKIAEIYSKTGRLITERNSLKKSYLLFADEYQVSKVANATANNSVRVIEKPVLATNPTSRGRLKILLLATLLGFFCGTATAFLVHAVQSKKKETAAA